MVKHQRRSHQQGLHPNEIIDDCSSDSDSGESPSTPQHSSVTWPSQETAPNHPEMSQSQPVNRSTSFSDFGSQVQGYPMQHQYHHRNDVSSGMAHEFHEQPVHDQHNDLQMVNRTPSIPQHSYYVTEQNNPGVATMNNSALQSQYQLGHHGVERPVVEIPYSAAGPTASVQSSPNSFSPVSGRSPSMHGSFYVQQPSHNASYTLQSTSPDSQPPPTQYSQPIQQGMEESQHSVANQSRPNHLSSVDQYQQPPNHQNAEQWYQCHPPIEVTTIGQLPPYGTGVYDIYGPKIEFDDPSMQLPSSRLESL